MRSMFFKTKLVGESNINEPVHLFQRNHTLVQNVFTTLPCLVISLLKHSVCCLMAQNKFLLQRRWRQGDMAYAQQVRVRIHILVVEFFSIEIHKQVFIRFYCNFFSPIHLSVFLITVTKSRFSFLPEKSLFCLRQIAHLRLCYNFQEDVCVHKKKRENSNELFLNYVQFSMVDCSFA